MPYQPPADENDGFEALTPGSYIAAIEEGDMKIGKDSGEPYVAWTFTIAEGTSQGRKCWNNTTLQPGKAWGFWAVVKAAVGEARAAELEKGTYEDEYDFVTTVAEECEGRLVELAIGNRMYNGQKQTDVQGVNPCAHNPASYGTPTRKAPRAAAASPAAAKRGRKDDLDF